MVKRPPMPAMESGGRRNERLGVNEGIGEREPTREVPGKGEKRRDKRQSKGRTTSQPEISANKDEEGGEER